MRVIRGANAAALLVPLLIASADVHGQECTTETTVSCQDECDQGRAVACHIVGEKILGGTSGQADENDLVDGNTLRRAAAAFKQACRGDFTWSCYKLAELEPLRKKHWRQKGLANDRRLCNRENKPWACARLGLVYKEGKLTRKNLPLAARLFEKACKADDINSCTHLGSFVDSAQDETKARHSSP